MRNRRWIIVTLATVILPTVTLLSTLCAFAGASGVCGACGKPIGDSYFETGGKFYHPECFTCDHCGKPIKGPFTVFRGKRYHTTCFEENVALRCAVCGGVIEGKYLLDHWGNAYHTRHEGNVLQCDFCQRFVVGALGDGMKRLPDDRTLCSKCAPTSVVSVREARSILSKVADDLARFGITVEPKPIELRLVGQDELARIAENRSHETKGFTDYLVKKGPFGDVKSETIKVYILHGMPRTQVVCTAAHELMHIWQFRNGSLEQDPALSEGSCNFASYLILGQIGTAEAQFAIDGMLKDPDRVYGTGFRNVKRYVERQGIPAWLRLLEKKNPDFAGR